MLLKSKADEKNNGTDEEIIKQLKTAFEETPVHSILSFSSKALKYEDIQLALKKLNNSISLN